MSARTNLAWCLFMQTLHQSGRESVFASLAESGVEVTSECQAPGQSSRRSGASDLLGDCLRQLTAVTQLSRSRDDQRDVEKLRGLVRLAGGEEAVVEAQVEAVRILQEITRDIFHSGLSDGHPLH